MGEFATTGSQPACGTGLVALEETASAPHDAIVYHSRGVVLIIADAESPLLHLVGAVAPAITGGNTCTVMASEKYPLTAIEFAEVLHASDVPGGTVNILTCLRKELLSQASSHMDINAFVFNDFNKEEKKAVQTNASLNVKRAVDFSTHDLNSPYRIMACQEIKTTWHPVGI